MSVSTAKAKEIIASLPVGYRATPVSGENFAQDPIVARDRLQAYAFSCGFLISHYRGSVKGGRISYKCVHYGESP